jgi:hypothetical protein
LNPPLAGVLRASGGNDSLVAISDLVSVKQSAARDRDPAVMTEGFPTGYGELRKGWAHVQFCLFGGDGTYVASQVFQRAE